MTCYEVLTFFPQMEVTHDDWNDFLHPGGHYTFFGRNRVGNYPERSYLGGFFASRSASYWADMTLVFTAIDNRK